MFMTWVFGTAFLKRTQEMEEIKAKTDKLDFTEIKKLCPSKRTIRM